MKEEFENLLIDLQDKLLCCDLDFAKAEEHLATIQAKRDAFYQCKRMIEEVLETAENAPSE